MSVLVIISALGALNGLIYTGSRIYATVGEDFQWLRSLARWHPRFGTPAVALIVQALITMVLMALVGTSPGRTGVNWLLDLIGLGAVSWEGHGGFDSLLRSTAPVFWLFFLLTGVSLFVLRWKEPLRTRPFRVPGYPVVPLIFCGMCAYMLHAATDYAGKLVLVGIVPVLLGLLFYLLGASRPRPVHPAVVPPTVPPMPQPQSKPKL
jgi:amino acid transporter